MEMTKMVLVLTQENQKKNKTIGLRSIFLYFPVEIQSISFKDVSKNNKFYHKNTH